MKTLFIKLIASNEINLARLSNNFDFLRLFAASLVIIAHSPIILGSSSLPWDPIQAFFGISMGRFGVLMFFIISGFLIAMSWEKKKNIVDFALGRVLRIYPAAIVIVLLSVFVLGPLLTTFSIDEYFSNDLTKQYIQDVTLYRMYYFLPGVFELNPISSINGSLWTLPYEFTCYIFLAILGLIKVISKKQIMLIAFVALLLIQVLFSVEINKIVIPIIGIDFKTFYSLFLYFISGSVFYVFREHIKLNILVAVLSAVILYGFKDTSISLYLSFILLTYIIMFVAFYKPLPFQKFGQYGDFSYGLYLYAFPVQQLIVYFFGDSISLFSMILLSFLFTFPFAYFSWNAIEKPSLKLRAEFNNTRVLK